MKAFSIIRMTHFKAGFLRAFVIAGLLTSFSLASTGCKSSQGSTDGTSYTRTSNGAIVEVKLDEYQIHMPTTIPHGHITFRIHNMGRMDHSFKISGDNGFEQKVDHDIHEGETTDFTVDLTPGTYGVICPMLTHPDLGMKLRLTVE